MIWENPEILIALAAVPFMILFLAFEWFRRKKRYKKYAAPEVFPELSSQSKRAEILRRICVIFGYSFFILALAGPRWGMISRKIEERSTSIIIVLDVSASMFCEDIKPNRFKSSIAKIKYLLSLLQAERFGLVGFAGRAFTICPVTGDLTSLRMFLDEIDEGLIPYPGTNLAAALRKAKESFALDTASRAVILFTDGENLQGNLSGIVKEMGSIRVFVVGVGTPEGEPIPLRDDKGNITGYKKNEEGETVISRLDEMTLLSIANYTEGRYFPYDRANRDIEQIAVLINSMDKNAFGESLETSLERKYHFPLAAALFFLLMDFLLPYLIRSRTLFDYGRPALLLAVLFTASSANASDISRGNRAFKKKDFYKAERYYRDALKKDASPEVYYNLGNTYYLMQKNDEAEKQYRKAMTFGDVDFEEDLIYNMGNNFYRKEDLGPAVESYRRVLRKNPAAEDALRNLELALKKQKKGEKGDSKKNEDKKSMSQEDIQRVMNVIDNMEKDSRRKRQRAKMPIVKEDW